MTRESSDAAHADSPSSSQDVVYRRRRSSLSPLSPIGAALSPPSSRFWPTSTTASSRDRPGVRRASTPPPEHPHSLLAQKTNSSSCRDAAFFGSGWRELGVPGKKRSTLSSQQHVALLLVPTVLYLMVLLSRMELPSDYSADSVLLFCSSGQHRSWVVEFDAGRTLRAHSDMVSHAQELLPQLSRRSFRPNYGNLKIPILDGGLDNFRRSVRDDDDDAVYHRERLEQLESIDRNADPRDFSSSDPGRYDHYDEIDYPKRETGCYRPKWSYEVHPTCQHFHELSLERPVESTGFDLRYLGRGYFRTTWLLESSTGSEEEFVLKLLKLNERRDFNQYTYFSIQAEALSMERTTASPHTSNIYGHCGASILVERGLPIAKSILPSYEFMKRQDVEQPRNLLDPPQKLALALRMAEGLAELHGDPSGVVVNDDIQLEQWLLGRDGYVKLNDFNNARFLQWDPERNQYCTFRASYDYLFRAPEEIAYHSTDESCDVYAVGQVFYAILTGLLPFYEKGGWDAAIEANGRGELPYVHTKYRKSRGFIEARLVELMKRIWQFKPRDRPSIFEVVSYLRETAHLYDAQNPSATSIANVSHFNLVEH